VITETHKGRKIKAVKGREWGWTRLTLNGVNLGESIGDQQRAIAGLKGSIDHADDVGVGSGRYGAEYYAPGSYELCEHGHARPVGGPCGHPYCYTPPTCSRPLEED